MTDTLAQSVEATPRQKLIQYTLTLRGAIDAAQARIASQPWVASIGAEPAAPAELNGATTLQVRVTDADAAEAQLLRLILEEEGFAVEVADGGQAGLDSSASRCRASIFPPRATAASASPRTCAFPIWCSPPPASLRQAGD